MDGFFAMGGHGGFIWPAYGIVALVLIALAIASRRFAKSSAAELDALNPRARRAERKSTNEA